MIITYSWTVCLAWTGVRSCTAQVCMHVSGCIGLAGLMLTAIHLDDFGQSVMNGSQATHNSAISTLSTGIREML